MESSKRPLGLYRGRYIVDRTQHNSDIPKAVLDTLKVHLVQGMDEVLKIALVEPLSGRLPAEAAPEPVETADVDDRITH